MRDRLLAIWNWVRETWGKATRRARIIFLGSVAGVLVLALIVTLLLYRKDYVVLYDDLTSTENAQVIAVLNENSIQYEVENGRLLVDSRDEGKARLQLAVLGFDNVGFNYDLANSGGLTATQKDKDRNYFFSLQNRLQATIMLFPEISRAIVTISMPEQRVFALDSETVPPSANITIQKKPGRTLTADQVRGIVNIVRDSVPGLLDSNISIVDENGDLKSTLNLDEDYNNRKLDLTEQVNRNLSEHILTMVQPLYGPEHIRVVANATLNTDSRVAEQVTYQPLDPENPTNNPLDYGEFSRDKTGDAFPAAGGVPGDQDNVGTPQYAAQEADAADANYYSGHDVYDYLVGSLREQIVKDGFVIEKAYASILINAASITDGQRDAIISLAVNATGIPRENITVQSMEFRKVDDDIETQPDGDPTVLFISLGIVLLVLCVILIAALTAVSRRNRARLAGEAAGYGQDGVPLIDLMNEDEEFDPITLVESPEQKLKLQIKDLAETDPEIVAQLIKTWLVNSK